MRFRRLRIAWSVGCVVVALLLCGLCVRSYWWTYGFTGHDNREEFGIGVERGNLVAAFAGVPKLSSLKLFWDSDLASYDEEMPGLWGFYCGQHPVGPGAVLLLVPLWFVATLVSAAIMLSWTRWVPWQFSLRTLLIATTLLAAVL